MALFDSGSPVANVALSDTFNTWRVRTNQINTQAAGLASNNTFTGTLNTFNNAVTVVGTLTADGAGFSGPITAPVVSANSLAGTLSTAAQPNITSLGTLTSLATTGLLTAPTVQANTLSGNLTGTASVATTVTLVATSSTDATHYPVFVDNATGDENIRTDTGFTYNPSSGILSSTDFNSTSDAQLKENIMPVENALALINSLTGYTFDWKNQNRSSVGVTAQDVEKHLPQLVTEINDHKTVNYNGLIGVLIEAVKELSKKVDSN
jgi:hypothetical protein